MDFEKTGIKPDLILPFKKTEPDDLNLHIFYPTGFNPALDSPRPGIVFFFGGGFTGGTVKQFYSQSAYLANRGMVAICSEYRTESRHGTTPRECVEDGKSAMRYIREHAAELGITPEKIAAGGGSAGGHIAAATALITDFDSPLDNLNISPIPDLLVLFNAVINNGPEGYAFDRVKGYYEAFSPYHNIKEGIAPSLFMLGRQDALIPVKVAEQFKFAVEKVGSSCDLILYKGASHGFFNWNEQDKGLFFKATLQETDDFLLKHKYLNPGENIQNWVKYSQELFSSETV